MSFDQYLARSIEQQLSTVMPGVKATHVATQVVQQVTLEWGGCNVYITKKSGKTRRNQQIKGQYNGNNVAQLCRRYRLSRSQFYKIINSEV